MKRSSSSEVERPNMSELRVVLLGGCWSQRDLFRKLILGGEDFNTEPNSFIKISKSEGNRSISVINTPDLLSPTARKLTDFNKECAKASAPGPHVFLLVLQPEDFTEEEKKRIYRVLNNFNVKSFDHSLVIILTPRQESLGSIEKCMGNPPLKELIRKCRYRHLFQMMVDPPDLLACLDQIVEENKGEHVSYDEEEATPDVASAFMIVLIGGGKLVQNELVNRIIGDEELIIHKPSSDCVASFGKRKGKPVTVVKFPDLFRLTEEKMEAEVKSCKTLCHPGPNVLLLIMENPDIFHRFFMWRGPRYLFHRDPNKMKSALSLFGPDAPKHSIIVTNNIKPPFHPTISDLISDCGGRCYSMNEDYEELMMKIEDIVKENEETFSTINEESTREKQLQDSPEEQSVEGLRIVLIGKTGSGKSSSGNTILARKEFKAAASPESVTEKCQRAQGEVEGQPVVVVDTPGLFDTNMSPEKADEELKKGISLVAPGPHVFLLVLQIGRSTPQDKDTFRRIEELLGENYKRFTIILFTHGDTLRHEGESVKDYIKNGCDDDCKKLIADCGGRYYVFNNYDINNRSQIIELIRKINNMVKDNQGSCFTFQM